MSKIVVTAKCPEPSPTFIMKIRPFVGGGAGEIRNHLLTGTPLFEAVLFGNDHEEQAERLRGVSDEADAAGVQLRFFELEPEEEFVSAPLSECEISIEVLQNILAEWDNDAL